MQHAWALVTPLPSQLRQVASPLLPVCWSDVGKLKGCAFVCCIHWSCALQKLPGHRRLLGGKATRLLDIACCCFDVQLPFALAYQQNWRIKLLQIDHERIDG